MALAFARLAAIAAATLVFLVFFGVTGGKPAANSGFGQTFSSCLRANGSKDSRMVAPRSGQTSSNTQKHMRALSLTAGLASDKDFLTDFSRISSPVEDSIACLER